MSPLPKTLGFSVLLILAFAAVTYVMPQMKGEAPQETAIDIGALTMDAFIAMGESLYDGAGNCSLCHNELGRAPDLRAIDVTATALERLSDPRFAGAATDTESYLRESMLNPDAYVVAGFGTKGSNDRESPMPAVDLPPIQLTEVEVDAIIAYLQSKDGNPVTVALPEAPSTGAEKPATSTAPPAAVADSAEMALAKYGCTACHAVLDSQATLGPELRDIATRQSAGEIRQSIVDPGAVVPEGNLIAMPEFPQMTVGELELIVDYLAQQTGESG